jgi:hypothetical protein
LLAGVALKLEADGLIGPIVAVQRANGLET